MMIASIVAVWFVVGLLVAMLFGAMVARTSAREQEEPPRRTGAELRYFRRLRRPHPARERAGHKKVSAKRAGH